MRYFVFTLFLLSCGIDDIPGDAGPDTRVRRDFKEVEFRVPDRYKQDAGKASCGDHVCNGNETWRSCWHDCTPQPMNRELRRDPGYIDPVKNIYVPDLERFLWEL